MDPEGKRAYLILLNITQGPGILKMAWMVCKLH
jgi:hypothetical protein